MKCLKASTFECIMTSNIDKEIGEILLSSSASEEVKISALKFFLGLTASEDGLKLVASSENSLSSICILANDNLTNVSEYAFKCLINLSSDEEIAGIIQRTRPDFLKDLLQYLKDVNNKNIHLACKILSNITTSPAHCNVVLSLFSQNNCLEDLLDVFCSTGESYDYLGSVFCNITQVEEGRRLFLDERKKIIQRLLPFITYMKSDVKRSGCVGAIRNCCFETDYHDWLLSDSVNILIPLLLPLAGPEEFDEEEMEMLPIELQYLGEEKQREPLASIRQMLIEAMIQLCATKTGRKLVREKQSYLVMRELHKVETSDIVVSTCENLVEILIGDEPESGMENLKEVEIPSCYAEQFEREMNE